MVENQLMKNERRNSALNFLKTNEMVLVFIIILIGAIFSIIQPVFISATNLFNIVRAISTLGIISLGVGLVMMLGEIDFSVGALIGLGGSLAGVLIERVGVINWVSLFIVLIVGALCGLLNGILVVKLKIPSFLATLGSSMLFGTLALVITNAVPVQRFADAKFFRFFAGEIGPFLRVEIIWLIVLCIIFYIILSKTYFGYYVYAVGGNVTAAKMSGIKTDYIKIIAYVISGVLAFIAGIISMCHMRVASPITGGGQQLYAIASVIMGGVRLSGGVGSVLGIVLGVILMGILNNGLIITGLPAFYHEGFIGVILLISIVVQVILSKKKSS